MFSFLFGRCLSGQEDDSSEDEGTDQGSTSTTDTYITTETYTGTRGEWSRLSAGMTGVPTDDASVEIGSTGATPVRSNDAFGTCPSGTGMNAPHTYGSATNMMNQNMPHSPYGHPYSMGGYGGNPYGAAYGTPQSMMMHRSMAPIPMQSHSYYPATQVAPPMTRRQPVNFAGIPVNDGHHDQYGRRIHPYNLRIKKQMTSNDVLRHPLSTYEPKWAPDGYEVPLEATIPKGFEIFKKMEMIVVERMKVIPYGLGAVNANNFQIGNKKGRIFFNALEYDAVVPNKLCKLRCVDIAGREVAMLKRELKEEQQNPCCDLRSDAFIWLTCGAKIGRIMKDINGYYIYDGVGQFAMQIVCPDNKNRMKQKGNAVAFDVIDYYGRPLGAIIRPGLPSLNTYQLDIPVKLHTQHKVLLMFAAIMIDCRLYE